LTGRQGDNIWDYDVWRLWTYQFAHAGVGHLLPNVLCQIIFGTLLEIVHGPLRVGSLYTIGVIFGGCFSLIVKPHLNLVGASAGVYALITAVLANTMLNWSELALWGRVARLVLAGGYLIADIANIYLTGTVGSVSYVAHLGGALVGALLGLVVLKNWEIKKYEVKCQTISFFMFLFVVIITAILLIFGDRTHTTFFN
jgi:rhomboid-related protein 1/2/3